MTDRGVKLKAKSKPKTRPKPKLNQKLNHRAVLHIYNFCSNNMLHVFQRLLSTAEFIAITKLLAVVLYTTST